jgi:acetoacetate decarboxylase
MPPLNGFMFPQSSTGASSLLPAPPWHYVGDLLTIRYRTDPDGIRAFLPPGLDVDPQDPGLVTLVFADWQSCSDDQHELLDPITAQYREAYFDVVVTHRGQRYARVIHIWVDKDFAMVRGHYQGYPKKHGSVHMTRAFPIGNAGPRLAAGARLGATLAASDRRLIDATITLREPAPDPPEPLPRLHTRRVPSIDPAGPDSLDELITMRRFAIERDGFWVGDATLNLYESPMEELGLLAPVEILGASYGTLASTWNGGDRVER